MTTFTLTERGKQIFRKLYADMKSAGEIQLLYKYGEYGIMMKILMAHGITWKSLDDMVCQWKRFTIDENYEMLQSEPED